MSEHTKGPWVAHEYGSPKGSFYVRGPNNERVVNGPSLTNEFNARLIAAAPDLLEALQRLVNCYSVSSSRESRDSCWNQARAAIAKATGEQP